MCVRNSLTNVEHSTITDFSETLKFRISFSLIDFLYLQLDLKEFPGGEEN